MSQGLAEGANLSVAIDLAIHARRMSSCCPVPTYSCLLPVFSAIRQFSQAPAVSQHQAVVVGKLHAGCACLRIAVSCPTWEYSDLQQILTCAHLGLLVLRAWGGCFLHAQAWLVRQAVRYQKEALQFTDERSKLEGELLNGIDVVKCNSWEVRRGAPGSPACGHSVCQYGHILGQCGHCLVRVGTVWASVGTADVVCLYSITPVIHADLHQHNSQSAAFSAAQGLDPEAVHGPISDVPAAVRAVLHTWPHPQRVHKLRPRF